MNSELICHSLKYLFGINWELKWFCESLKLK